MRKETKQKILDFLFGKDREAAKQKNFENLTYIVSVLICLACVISVYSIIKYLGGF